MARANRSDRRFIVTVAIAATALAIVVLLVASRPPIAPGPDTTPSAAPSGGLAATAASAQPGTSGSPPQATTVPTFGTAPPADAVLVGAGDIADCASDGDEATAKLLDQLDGTVFTLGDNVYESGSSSEFRRCYAPGWGRQLDRTKPVPGNHDYETAGAAGYFGYFGAAAGDPATGWYAYDVGAWRVYVLNSNCALIGGCDTGSPQERWLRHDLAANPRACVVAMWHHPRFSSGLHGNDQMTTDLWSDLYDAGAELILNGHDHDYERFAAQTPRGEADPARGIVEIVVGTGGRSHYPFGTIRANSVVRDATTYGVLRLVLSGGGWSFEFMPAAGGGFSDSGSGTCH
jgi:acid phosphatase type 7